jgi:signal transduction histidine kinase
MRRFFPDSLAAWALLILIGGLTAAQLSTLAVIVRNRDDGARMTGFFHLAERVSSLSRAVAAEPVDQRADLAAALSNPTLTVAVDTKPSAANQVGPDDELAELEDVLQARLADSGIADVHVERKDRADMPAGEPLEQPDEDAGPVERALSLVELRYAGNDVYLASLELEDGSWLNFAIPVPPTPSLWSLDTVLLAVATIVLVLIISGWAVRRLTAPYAALASAAERFGRDINTTPMPETGPREVRAAAHAFNLMQSRLKRFVGDRDHLVAAISHDLRTPVTRLRLRAEFVDDSQQRGRMLEDLDEIETMTRSVLAFASETAQPEPRETVDLISLLETLTDDMPNATFDLAPDLPARLAYPAQPVGLRRCIGNLIDNAVKYGRRARASLVLLPHEVRIRIDDDGPGIPEDEVERMFQPFQRLDRSRNRETGGTGLGLTTARTVAHAHGGEIVLSNRDGGGLRAEIVLPRTVTALADRAA